MIKLRRSLLSMLFLPASLVAYDSGHPCIDDFMRFVAIVDGVGQSELRQPGNCKPEWIDVGRPFLYSRYCDESKSVTIRATIVIHDMEPHGMSCSAGIDYGRHSSTDCSSDQEMEVNSYSYSSEERFLDAKLKLIELCSVIDNVENTDLGK